MPTSSSRFSDSGYGGSSSSSGGNLFQSGTQLIEDSQTQVQPDAVNNEKEKCEDINSEGCFLGEARNDGTDPELCAENHKFSLAVRERSSGTWW